MPRGTCPLRSEEGHAFSRPGARAKPGRGEPRSRLTGRGASHGLLDLNPLLLLTVEGAELTYVFPL